MRTCHLFSLCMFSIVAQGDVTSDVSYLLVKSQSKERTGMKNYKEFSHCYSVIIVLSIYSLCNKLICKYLQRNAQKNIYRQEQ